MGKNFITFGIGKAQGRCLSCNNRFIGPGDRCPKCRTKLVQRRKRKPR